MTAGGQVKRWATLIVLAGILTLLASRSIAEPWPIDTVNPVRLDDANRVKDFPIQGGTTLKVLRSGINRRQTVNATFGEPRPFSRKASYLHNGVDVADPLSRKPASGGNNVTPGSPVFTIQAGLAERYQNRGNDFEYVRVGDFQYMHLAVDPAIANLARARSQVVLPRGTYIGVTKTLTTNGMGPHCHLMWVKRQYWWYNALSILDPWSDTSPPSFLNRPTSLAPQSRFPQNIPPVRIVPDFDPSDKQTPIKFFPEGRDPASLTSNVSVSVVSGACWVLARVGDQLRSDAAHAGGGSLAGSPKTVPAAVDLQLEQRNGSVLLQPHLVNFGYNNLDVLSSAQADFQRPILIADDQKASSSSSPYFRDIYWVNSNTGLGSTLDPLGPDFILGNSGDFALTVEKLVLPIRTDELAQDGLPRSPNGRYRARVRAYDLSDRFTLRVSAQHELRREFNPPVERSADCLLCNKATITHVADPLTGVVLEDVELGKKLRIGGYNLFSPLEERFQDPPLIELLQERNGALTTVYSDRAIRPLGDNRQGTCEFTMPLSGLDPAQDLFMAASIRCNPDPSFLPGDPDPSKHERGVLKKIRLAQRRAADFVAAYKDGDRIMLLEKTGTAAATVRPFIDLPDSSFWGVSVSADGGTLAVSHGGGTVIAKVNTGPAQMQHVLERSYSPSLSGDGTRLAAVVAPNDSEGSEEFRVADLPPSGSGTATWKVLHSVFPSQSQYIWSPAISPNGQHAAFVRVQQGTITQAQVFHANVDTGQVTTVGNLIADIYPLFVADDGTVAGTASTSEGDGTSWFPFTGRPGATLVDFLTSGRDVYGISGDARRILLRTKPEADVQAHEYHVLDLGSRTIIRSISSPNDSNATLTRDGRFVLHVRGYSDDSSLADFELVDVDTNTRQIIARSIAVSGELFFPRGPQFGGGTASGGVPTISAPPAIAVAAPGPI